MIKQKAQTFSPLIPLHWLLPADKKALFLHIPSTTKFFLNSLNFFVEIIPLDFGKIVKRNILVFRVFRVWIFHSHNNKHMLEMWSHHLWSKWYRTRLLKDYCYNVITNMPFSKKLCGKKYSVQLQRVHRTIQVCLYYKMGSSLFKILNSVV